MSDTHPKYLCSGQVYFRHDAACHYTCYTNARYDASDYLLLLHSRGKWSNFCPKRLPMPGPVIGASHTMPLLVSLNFWFLKLTTGGSLVLAGCYGDNPTWIWIRTKSPPRFNVQLKHNGQMEVYTLSYVQLGKNPR